MLAAGNPRTRWVCAGAFAVSVCVYLFVRWLSHPTMIDLAVYRVEGDAIRHGIDLYDHLATPKGLRATYPTFAALLFVPFSYLSFVTVETIVVVVNLLLLLLVCAQSCRLAGVDAAKRADAALVLAAIGIWAEPVFTTFRYGQINLALLALVLWDFLRAPTARTRGVGIGIATAIKITPGIFVLYLLLTRRFRMALNAVVAYAVATGLSAAVAPSQTWRFWTKLLWQSSRVGRPENAANQSVRGLIVRSAHSRDIASAWTLLIAAVAIAGIACAVFVYRRLGDCWGAPVIAVTGMLAAPIAWTHHWVWCVPIAILLWQHRRRWLPIVAVFWTFAVWAIPHTDARELRFPAWEVAVSAWYVLFGVLFLGLAAWTAVLTGRRAEVVAASG